MCFAIFAKAMATSACANQLRLLRGRGVLNHFHNDTIVTRIEAIGHALSTPPMGQLLEWINDELCVERERTRRLISHFGVIDGVDWGNVSYGIIYRMMCDLGPAERDRARTFSSPNSCGNLLEASLGCAHFVVELEAGRINSEMLREILSTKRWATPVDVDNAVVFILRQLMESPLMARIPDFVDEFGQAVRGCWAIVYGSTGLFDGINRRSSSAVLAKAVADFEAIRLGWPSAQYSHPGYRSKHDQWVVLPIDLFPERERELIALLIN